MYETLPKGNRAIINKAITRAKEALREDNKASYSVGFAAGILEIENQTFVAVWCAVLTSQSKCHLGGGLNIELPKYLDDPFERLVRYALANAKDISSG